MDSAMDGVDFNSGHHIETGLLKAQAQPSSARKQVDSDWPWHTHSPAVEYQLSGFRAKSRSESS
jgi:hypothetical protein